MVVIRIQIAASILFRYGGRVRFNQLLPNKNFLILISIPRLFFPIPGRISQREGILEWPLPLV
jgi:hypothetical protein